LIDEFYQDSSLQSKEAHEYLRDLQGAIHLRQNQIRRSPSLNGTGALASGTAVMVMHQEIENSPRSGLSSSRESSDTARLSFSKASKEDDDSSDNYLISDDDPQKAAVVVNTEASCKSSKKVRLNSPHLILQAQSMKSISDLIVRP